MLNTVAERYAVMMIRSGFLAAAALLPADSRLRPYVTDALDTLTRISLG